MMTFPGSAAVVQTGALEESSIPVVSSFHWAVHSIITFGNLVFDFFKFIDFSFVVGVPRCRSVFKVWKEGNRYLAKYTFISSWQLQYKRSSLGDHQT